MLWFQCIDFMLGNTVYCLTGNILIYVINTIEGSLLKNCFYTVCSVYTPYSYVEYWPIYRYWNAFSVPNIGISIATKIQGLL